MIRDAVEGVPTVRRQAARRGSRHDGTGTGTTRRHRGQQATVSRGFHVAKNNPRCGLWLDQLSLGISRKRMSVLAMVP